MRKANRSSRRVSKRAAMVDLTGDESTNDQPAEKTVKKEEDHQAVLPTPATAPASQPVQSKEVELQQKVAELEKDREGTQFYLKKELEESKKRVESLENLLGIQPDAITAKEQVDELQKLLDEKTKELNEVRLESVYKIKTITQQMKDKEAKAAVDRKKDRERLNEKTKELDEVRKESASKIKTIAQQLKAEEAGAKQDRRRDGDKIYQLSRLVQAASSKNIFQMFDGDSQEIFSFVQAKKTLHMCREKARSAAAVGDSVWEDWLKQQFNGEKLECKMCKETVSGKKIIDHFLSKSHGAKVRAPKTAISLVAIEYWAQKLMSIPGRPMSGLAILDMLTKAKNLPPVCKEE